MLQDSQIYQTFPSVYEPGKVLSDGDTNVILASLPTISGGVLNFEFEDANGNPINSGIAGTLTVFGVFNTKDPVGLLTVDLSDASQQIYDGIYTQLLLSLSGLTGAVKIKVTLLQSSSSSAASGGGGSMIKFGVLDPLQTNADLTVLSIKDASDTQKGAVVLQDAITDVTSTTKATTPQYVYALIQQTIANPNQLAPAFIACATNIALTGSVTYAGIKIPTGSRVIATGQIDATTNGVWVSNDSGAWTRAADADTTAELHLAQIYAPNGDIGLYLCTIATTAVIGTDPITFIALYQTSDTMIGVLEWTSTLVCSTTRLYQYQGDIWQCLINGTTNVIPDNASPAWVQVTGFVRANYAQVTSNGLDDKGNSLPYLTVQKAIDDLTIAPTIDVLNTTTTENITLKSATYIRGENGVLNGSITNTVSNVTLKDYKINGTIANLVPLVINGALNFNYDGLTATANGASNSINISGVWEGANYIKNSQLSGNINITGATTAGVIYFQDIYDTLTLTLNSTNATVFIANCPNFTLVRTAGTIIDTASDKYGTLSASGAIPASQEYTLCTAATASYDVNLPDATLCKGKLFKVKNLAASLFSIGVTGATTAVTLAQGTTALIESNGVNWEVLSAPVVSSLLPLSASATLTAAQLPVNQSVVIKNTGASAINVTLPATYLFNTVTYGNSTTVFNLIAGATLQLKWTGGTNVVIESSSLTPDGVVIGSTAGVTIPVLQQFTSINITTAQSYALPTATNCKGLKYIVANLSISTANATVTGILSPASIVLNPSQVAIFESDGVSMNLISRSTVDSIATITTTGTIASNLEICTVTTPVTRTLPAAALWAGQKVQLVNLAASTNIVTLSGAVAPVTILPNQTAIVESDGASWQILVYPTSDIVDITSSTGTLDIASGINIVTTASAVTRTLPAAVLTKGRVVKFINDSTSTANVTIAGITPNIVLLPNQTTMVESDGTIYRVLVAPTSDIVDTTSTTGAIAQDTNLNVVTTAAAVTRTLPAVALSTGKVIKVINATTSTNRVTIGGAISSVSLNPGESAAFESNGTAWLVVVFPTSENINTNSTTGTLAVGDTYNLVTATVSAVTRTLASALLMTGKKVTITNASASTFVTTVAGITPNIILTPAQTTVVESDGTNWQVVVPSLSQNIDTTSTTGTIASTTNINHVTTASAVTRTLPSAVLKNGRSITVSNLNGSAANTVVTVAGVAGGNITLYPNESVTCLSNGTTWIATNYIQRALRGSAIFNLSANDGTNLTSGNHSPLNQTLSSDDPYTLITRGTSAYSTAVGVNSLGRALLKAGYVYKITGTISTTSGPAFFGYQIYNVTTAATKIGTFGAGFANATQDANVQSLPSWAIVSIPVGGTDQIVETRLTGGTLTTWYAGNTNLSETAMIIEVVGRL